MPYLYIETARERLCRGSRLLLSGLCNGTLVPSALRAVRDKNHHQTVKVVFPEQSADAVIYVTVVVIFYAAIILILVGTNIHRFRRPGVPPIPTPIEGQQSQSNVPNANMQQVLVRLDHRERAYPVSTTQEELNHDMENQETDGAPV
ncbi:uncharacterized protein LOC129222674 [Uloborus diversus]|uniref:uncharacterized protein LOC129222674 n=1 Tax=Uloborus diversus TaxID=327109 RepID=UPI00240A2BFA|nr:uncharacterized protein LOC129222674 [Uloborus diversus]